jgi:hypothetical protein
MFGVQALAGAGSGGMAASTGFSRRPGAFEKPTMTPISIKSRHIFIA